MFKQLFQASMARFQSCQLCGLERQQIHSLCQDCWEDLPWSKQSIQRHGHEILVACDYRFPMDRIIQKFKYEQQLQYQNLLAQSLLCLELPKVDALLAMPISKQRLIERGFNQMLIIARIMSLQLNIPIWQPVIRAAQHSQKGLSRLERIEQIEQQFQIIPKQKQRYQRVLIVDDVVTTGSSIHALAQALQRIGCQHVTAACIAAAR